MSPWHWLIMLVVIGLPVAVIVTVVKKSSKGTKTYSGPVISPVMTPGWYPDANDPNLTRYFDGREWTSSTRNKG